MQLKIKISPKQVKQGKDVHLIADQGDPDVTSAYNYSWSVTPAAGYAKPGSKGAAKAGPAKLSDVVEDNSSPVTVLHTYDIEEGQYQVAVQRTPKEEGSPDQPEEAQVTLTVESAGTRDDVIRRAALDTSHRATRAVEDARDAAFQAADSLRDGIKVGADKRSPTLDQALWVAIRECVGGRDFEAYSQFIDRVLCDEKPYSGDCEPLLDCRKVGEKSKRSKDCYKIGVQGYKLLKAATEVFLLCHCCGDLRIRSQDADEEEPRLGFRPGAGEMQGKLEQYLQTSVSPATLPYLKQIVQNLNLDTVDPEAFYPFCENSIRDKLCLFELIWSYWQEEGMLVQTLHAISLRFQNRRLTSSSRDPLANLEMAPLYPLNNLLWGYIQNSEHQLSLRRRAYEYEHHYGLQLVGKAVGRLNPADRRSKFLEAFHNLLQQSAQFYKDDSNQWITPDTFPLLNALRTVHLLLAEGAHNQFGDLPSTARQEMLIQQWLLAQPPMREFLHSRAMVPYEEQWMGQVDAMKKMMGWTDVSIIHFHKLAVFGEKILLSIRYGDWNDINATADQAANWTVYWRPEVQGYIEAYRAATGVQLAANVQRLGKVDSTLPSVHLKRRARQTA
ncbi:MAG: hypothetical protein V3T83_08945 [Acidobacteriota bacterium]